MIALEVKDGVVVNRPLVGSADFAASRGWVIPPNVEAVNIGWVQGRDGTFAPPVAPEFDAPAARAHALAVAMAYGGAIIDGELSTWTGAEPLSWPLQREEALAHLRGETLDALALIPGLAADKGVSLTDYARSVIAHAARYQTIVRVSVQIRRRAEEVFGDPALDTQAKIDAARDALQIEVDAVAASLLGASIPVPTLETEGFIPTALFRLRAEALGIWDDVTAYLSQSPALWMRVFSLEKGLLNPNDDDLIDGLGGAGVKPFEKTYLLLPPELGVPDAPTS